MTLNELWCHNFQLLNQTGLRVRRYRYRSVKDAIGALKNLKKTNLGKNLSIKKMIQEGRK